MIDFSCQDKTDELCESSRKIIAQHIFAVIGVGALGTSALQALVRSGVNKIILIDDDDVEATNLPRQILFDEKSIGQKKVEVAKEKLLLINKDILINTHAVRLSQENTSLVEKADVILDCTDSIASRIIIDDYCKKNKKPWVHAAVNKSFGEVIAILPSKKTYAELIKNKKVIEDCSITGVLSIAAIITGSFQATVALRVLIDKEVELANTMFRIDAWKGEIHQFTL